MGRLSSARESLLMSVVLDTVVDEGVRIEFISHLASSSRFLIDCCYSAKADKRSTLVISARGL